MIDSTPPALACARRTRNQSSSLPAVSSPIAATGPLVERDSIVLRLSDPDEALAGVRLATDRGFPVAAEPFAREGDGWTLRMPAPALDRFEYALEVQRADGGHEHWTDPANPLRAPGAFGEKSVVQLPGYAAPAWLGAEQVPGATDRLTVASSALGAELEVAIWRPHGGARRRAAAPARRPRRPRARPARAPHRLQRGAHRLGRAPAPPRRARRTGRSRPVVLGERAVRAYARHARTARRSPTRSPCAGRWAPGSASGRWRCCTPSDASPTPSRGSSCSRAASSCRASTRRSRASCATGGSCASCARRCASRRGGRCRWP